MQRPTVAILLILSLVALSSAVPIQEGARVAPPAAEDVEGPICDECKKIVGSLLVAAKQANATYEAKLEKYLDEQVCEKLPAEYVDPCKTAVNDDVPEFWDQIVKELMDPLGTCEKMLLCASATPAEGAGDSDFACDVCMKAAKYIDENVFESAEVDKKVAKHLIKLCDDIPDMKPEALKKCQLLVMTDTPIIMEEIGKALSEQLCTDAGVCE